MPPPFSPLPVAAPPPPTAPPRPSAPISPRLSGLLTAGALATVLAVASLCSSAEALPLFCLFRKLTTLPCPSCGLTRAFVAMGHGHWTAASVANLAGPTLYAACWLALALALGQGLSGRRWLVPFWTRSHRWLVPAVLGLMAAAWLANLLRRFSA